jgi:hypothetical protein
VLGCVEMTNAPTYQQNKDYSVKKLLGDKYHLYYYNTQHNDTQHSYTQNKESLNDDTQHHDAQKNEHTDILRIQIPSIMTTNTVTLRSKKLLIMTLSIMIHRKMCMQTYYEYKHPA